MTPTRPPTNPQTTLRTKTAPPPPTPPSPHLPISPSPSPRRTAFATATALVMLAILASLALLTTRHLRDQAKRTTRDADQAQLRQLLHAGGLLASDLPAIWSATGPQPQTLNVPLPKELTPSAATLQITTHPTPDGATATITATLPPHRAQQTLTFHKSPQGWTLTSVQPN